jgi:outer membrane protein insertion porin family
MRLAAGPSIKSSLTHSWVYDTQDDKIVGTRGAMTKFSHELAGGPALGGDAAFYKAETEYHISRKLLNISGTVRTEVCMSCALLMISAQTWSFGARTGALVPLFGKPSFLPDLFQLGGPTNVRLFRSNSMGPRDGGMCAGIKSEYVTLFLIM